MSEKVKIYHVETQADYDDLMIELEAKGYKWLNGDKPTARNLWFIYQEETVIYLNEVTEHEFHFGSLSYAKREYPDKSIIKHKANGVEQMEKVVVPQCVADWFKAREDVSLRILLNKLARCDDEQVVNWVDYVHFLNAQDILAKMHLFGYEVEEEKKYYWRKKKEHYLSTEYGELPEYIQLDLELNAIFSSKNTREIQGYKVKFTEKEMFKLVGKEDFTKLEKVEITE